MGLIEAVCISADKGVIKIPLNEITLRVGWGIEGDAHAGEWHRQVSLLAGESIDRMREKMPEIDHGMFAENIVGDSLNIGDDVVLEITQIGKECHNAGCAIKRTTGECIMPKEGLFCRVLEGGRVTPGMSIK